MLGGLGEGIALLGLVLLVGKVWVMWRILDRIQLNPWLALAFLVPILGEALLLWWLAFARWPLNEEMEAGSEKHSEESGEAYWTPGAVGSTDVVAQDDKRQTPPQRP